MTILNYTPHPVILYSQDQDPIVPYATDRDKVLETFPVAGKAARVGEKVILKEDVEGCPVVYKEYTEIEGIPEEKEGILYLVSVVVLQANNTVAVPRVDLLCPDTGPDSVVRNSQGHILGVRRFQA